jgi:ribosomal protein S18 acetylase RimI-like enzyme
MIQLLHVTSEPYLSEITNLFREYADSLTFNLCFQGFEKELADLPGAYAPPKGLLLLALLDGNACGCGAFRPLEGDVCEMKRLYVRPASRGLGIGKMLAQSLITEARARGYRFMKLDTIETMREAISLYRSLGFRETKPYTPNPIPGAEYFALSLREDLSG